MSIIVKTIIAINLLFPQAALAHVKWFSDYRFDQPPLNISDLNHFTFWALIVLSMVSFPLLVYLDKLLDKSLIYQKMNQFFDHFSDNATLILRVAVGASFLLSWQADSMIAPELTIAHPFWGWFQFVLALLLLTRQTTPFAGMGMVLLYAMAMFNYGLLHMLDYLVYLGIGYYFIATLFNSAKLRDTGIPVLYSSLGFSLCWLALEKIFYPYWGLAVLEQAPQLTMGFNHEFFLLGAAFVEFALGYLLIICLLSRPLALVITLVFFTTTLFFGKVEVIGHTMLHGALLVFVVKGAGNYFTTPINFHKSTPLKMAFASVNYIILFVLLIFPYSWMSHQMYEDRAFAREQQEHPVVEIASTDWRPQVTLEKYRDPHAGWNLHLKIENFEFAPQSASTQFVEGEGHAHLYINGEKIGRLYSQWRHINLPPGENIVRVTLNSNDHKDISIEGVLVEDVITIFEDRDDFQMHNH